MRAGTETTMDRVDRFLELAGAGASASVSNTISGEPTATVSPSSPARETTGPPTGEATATAAFSVRIAQIGSASTMTSPTCTRY